MLLSFQARLRHLLQLLHSSNNLRSYSSLSWCQASASASQQAIEQAQNHASPSPPFPAPTSTQSPVDPPSHSHPHTSTSSRPVGFMTPSPTDPFLGNVPLSFLGAYKAWNLMTWNDVVQDPHFLSHFPPSLHPNTNELSGSYGERKAAWLRATGWRGQTQKRRGSQRCVDDSVQALPAARRCRPFDADSSSSSSASSNMISASIDNSSSSADSNVCASLQGKGDESSSIINNSSGESHRRGRGRRRRGAFRGAPMVHDVHEDASSVSMSSYQAADAEQEAHDASCPGVLSPSLLSSLVSFPSGLEQSSGCEGDEGDSSSSSGESMECQYDSDEEDSDSESEIVVEMGESQLEHVQMMLRGMEEAESDEDSESEDEMVCTSSRRGVLVFGFWGHVPLG